MFQLKSPLSAEILLSGMHSDEFDGEADTAEMRVAPLGTHSLRHPCKLGAK